MCLKLKIDPRKALSFRDFSLPGAVLSRLQRFQAPLPLQTKILAVNGSGISVFAKSMPNQGKTTAAIIGLLSVPRQPNNLLTNLVLVPTPAMAQHYVEKMQLFGGNVDSCKTLYRTGSVDEDEEQHEDIKSSMARSSLATLIATPQRALDYISYNPSFLALGNLRQLVVEELDVFGATSPLEKLLEYVLTIPGNNPILTLLASASRESDSLSKICSSLPRPMLEVSEPAGTWHGTCVEIHNAVTSDVKSCAKRIKEAWAGPGLVVPPPSTSPLQLQAELSSMDGAVVTQPSEVAGLHIENLENIYILAADKHNPLDVERLKWFLSEPKHLLHLFKN